MNYLFSSQKISIENSISECNSLSCNSLTLRKALKATAMINLKCNLAIGILLFAPFVALSQLIPNGNFESWYPIGNFENPEFWDTDNTQTVFTVTKDFDSYEGEIAMRVTSQPIGVGEYGEAFTLILINAIPSALNFYAKYSTEAGGVSVEISFVDAAQTEVAYGNWSSVESMEDYTFISLPITPVVTSEQLPPVYAIVSVSAQVGDLVGGHAWISVDAMDLGTLLSLKDLERSEFEIYPNPASERITIQSSQGVIGNLKIFDAQGKVVFEKRISDTTVDIDIHKLSPGVYTLRSDKMNIGGSTFIVK